MARFSAMDRPFTLIDLAEVIAEYIERERFLFELTGGWSSDGDVDSCRGFFAEQSAFHAWRLEQWEARMPRSVEPDRLALEELAAGLRGAALNGAGLTELIDDGQRLAVWSWVLVPRSVAGYRDDADRLREAADRGLRRMQRIVGEDSVASMLAGQKLLRNILTRSDGYTEGGAGVAELVAETVRQVGSQLW